MYLYNIFYLKESVGRLFTLRFLSNIGQKIEQKTNDFNKQLKLIKQGDYDKWVIFYCYSYDYIIQHIIFTNYYI
jgi:hypothetical protein